MSIEKLVDFCNRFRVTPATIIFPAGSKPLMTADTYFINYQNWTPVYFDAELMCGMFDDSLDSSIGSTLADLSNWVGVTPQTVNAWFHGTASNGKKPNINVNLFLKICNHYHINPSTILQCPACPIQDLWQPVRYSPKLQQKLTNNFYKIHANDSKTIFRLKSDLFKAVKSLEVVLQSVTETDINDDNVLLKSDIIKSLRVEENHWKEIFDQLSDVEV